MYFIGPWDFDKRDQDFQYWKAPAGKVVLDLRPRDAKNATGAPHAKNLGLFYAAAAPAGAEFVALGGHHADRITVAKRNRIKSALGVALSGTTVAQMMRSLLLQFPDYDQSSHVSPLSMRRDRRVGLWLPVSPTVREFVGRRVSGSTPEFTVTRAKIRRAYRKYRKRQGSTIPVNYHRRYLTHILEKFGRVVRGAKQGQLDAAAYREFIPADLPDEKPLPHSTTDAEDFNVGSDTPVGTNTTLSGADWTKIEGTPEAFLSGGQFGTDQSDQATMSCDTDFASSDLFSQITIDTVGTDTNDEPGVTVRNSGSSLEFYLGDWKVGDGGEFRLYERDTGWTLVDSDGVPTDLADGEVLRVEADGSNLELLRDAVSVVGPSNISAVNLDDNIQAGIRHRGGSSTTPRGDDWSGGDLGAAAATSFPPFRQRIHPAILVR